MKPLLLSLLVFLLPATTFGEITLDLVLETLRKQSVAANSGDIKGLVATVPGKGTVIHRKVSDEAVTLKKVEMTAQLESFFKTIKPRTYLYGVRLCSVDEMGTVQDIQAAEALVLLLDQAQIPARRGCGEAGC